MRNRLLLVSLILGLGVTLILLRGLGNLQGPTLAAARHNQRPTSGAAELRVCHEGCVYTTVQAAVDAAHDYDVIKVATGIYTGVSARDGVTQVVYVSKTVTIQGGYTTTDWSASYPLSYPTMLDAQGQGRVLYIAGDVNPTIAGLHLTGGDATGLRGYAAYWPEEYDAGGGVYMGAAATLADCQIYVNTAQWGGGVYVAGNLTQVDGNAIYSNTAWTGGGLALVRALTVEVQGNAIWANFALGGEMIEGGGGVYLESSPAATFSGNYIHGNDTLYEGGGLYLLGTNLATPVTLVNNVIADNNAGSGGGMSVAGSDLRGYHNTFARNDSVDGSGIHAYPWGPKVMFPYSVMMTNTVMVSHTIGISMADGFVVPSPDDDWYNKLLVNGVLLSDTPITISAVATTVVEVQHQYTGDPGFAADGYHLTIGSAAIDRGVETDVVADVDGDPRPRFGSDLGADEFPAALQVSKQATPDPVRPGERLTYNIRVINTGSADLHATVTDTLPTHIEAGQTASGTAFMPGGRITWMTPITAPGGVWEETLVFTAAEGYAGPLTNWVTATTEERATAAASVTSEVGWYVYLPLVLRNYGTMCETCTASLMLSAR